MAKYVLKIKGKSYGVKRWFTRSVTIQLGVMKYNNVSINLKEFEVVTDDDYKRGKYDYYFELREKISLIDKPKIYQCRAEDEASFKEWINRIENICGRMDSYYLGKPVTPNGSPLRGLINKSPRKSTPRPVKRSNSWHGQEESHRQKLKSYDYDFRITVIKKVGKSKWQKLSFKERLEIMETEIDSKLELGGEDSLQINMDNLAAENMHRTSPSSSNNKDKKKKKKKKKQKKQKSSSSPKNTELHRNIDDEEDEHSTDRNKDRNHVIKEKRRPKTPGMTPVSKKGIRRHNSSPGVGEANDGIDNTNISDRGMDSNTIKHALKKSSKKKKRARSIDNSHSDAENAANAVVKLNLDRKSIIERFRKAKKHKVDEILYRKQKNIKKSLNNNNNNKNFKVSKSNNRSSTQNSIGKNAKRHKTYSNSASRKLRRNNEYEMKRHHQDSNLIKTRPITSAAINRWSNHGDPDYIQRLRPGELKKFELQERLAYKRSGLKLKAQQANKIPHMHCTLDSILRSYTNSSTIEEDEGELKKIDLEANEVATGDNFLTHQMANSKSSIIKNPTLGHNDIVESSNKRILKSVLPKHYGNAVLASRHSYISSTLKDGCIIYSHPAEYTAPVQYSKFNTFHDRVVSHNVVEPMTPPRQRGHPLAMRMSRLSSTAIINPNNTPIFWHNKTHDNSMITNMDNVNLQMDDELELPRELKIEHLSPIDRSSPPVVHNKMKGKPSLNNNKKNVSTPATTKIIKLEQEIIDLDKKLEKYKHLNH